MKDYRHLDINEKINFKGLVDAWSNITIQRFQKQLDDKVYNRQRSSKKRSLVRTGKLRSDWRKQLYLDRGNGGVKGLQLSFLLYGRFVDMGVGNGKDHALSKWQRKRSNGETATRKPARWYSKEKGYQVHRLRELLTKYYINVSIASLEEALTSSVTIHV